MSGDNGKDTAGPQGGLSGRPTGEPDYRSLFQACPLPAFVWREQGGVFRLDGANAAGREFTAGRGDAAPGVSPEALHPDIPEMAGELRRCLDNAGNCEREISRSSDGPGPTRHLCFHFARIAPDLVMVQARDITSRKEAEAVRDEMERVSRHDLKSPLNIVIGVANLLKDDANLEPAQRESLEMIESAGYSMLNIINVSLELSRIKRGEYEYLPRPVDMASLIRRITGQLRLRLESRGLGLEIFVEGRPVSGAGVFIVPGDETLCHCLLESLARCAMFLARRGSAVRVFMDREGDEVVVGVRFSGRRDVEASNPMHGGPVPAGHRPPSEADMHKARTAAQAMGGRLELRSTADETVLAARLPA